MELDHAVVRPGELLIVTCRRHLSPEQLHMLRDSFPADLKHRVVVIPTPDIQVHAMSEMQPIDMVIFCPGCGTQHIDEPSDTWDNPPHRSHLCHACGYVWRPADVCTNGVAVIKTRGEADSAPHETARHDAADDYDNECRKIMDAYIEGRIIEYENDGTWISAHKFMSPHNIDFTSRRYRLPTVKSLGK